MPPAVGRRICRRRITGGCKSSTRLKSYNTPILGPLSTEPGADTGWYMSFQTPVACALRRMSTPGRLITWLGSQPYASASGSTQIPPVRTGSGCTASPMPRGAAAADRKPEIPSAVPMTSACGTVSRPWKSGSWPRRWPNAREHRPDQPTSTAPSTLVMGCSFMPSRRAAGLTKRSKPASGTCIAHGMTSTRKGRPSMARRCSTPQVRGIPSAGCIARMPIANTGIAAMSWGAFHARSSARPNGRREYPHLPHRERMADLPAYRTRTTQRCQGRSHR
jgi:hypothetical protein